MRYIVLMFVAMLSTTTLYAQETKGEEQKTQTKNPLASFGPSQALSTERVLDGNRGAMEADGSGHNVHGKIMVRVRVDKSGNVMHAEYMLEGSTTQDSTLMKLAIEAALKAKFVESDHEDEGTILYNFEFD